MITVGDPLPDFELKDDTGTVVRRSDLIGKKVVLYFYPKDNTSGCTQQACDLRDRHADFQSKEFTIVGISPDSPGSHKRFKEKYELPFQLLCDPNKELAQQFGVVKEKSMYGKKVKGIERSTFLIGEDGTVIHELRGVKVPKHVDDLLVLLESLP